MVRGNRFVSYVHNKYPLMPCLDVGIPFSPFLGEGSFVGGCCALGLPEAGFSLVEFGATVDGSF